MRRQNSNFSNGTRMNTDFRGFFYFLMVKSASCPTYRFESWYGPFHLAA
jgi:hypothetical protein